MVQTRREILLLLPHIFGDLLLIKTSKEFIVGVTRGLKADKTKNIQTSVALSTPLEMKGSHKFEYL